MPHPAQIRDAVQVYIEQQYHPVRTWHVQDEIANRLDGMTWAVGIWSVV